MSKNFNERHVGKEFVPSLLLVLGALAVILMLISAVRSQDAVQKQSTLSAGSELNAPLTAAKMTDADRYAQSKALLASWNGDANAYWQAMGFLAEIHAGSSVYPAGRALVGKWRARNAEHERHERQASAKMARKQAEEDRIAAREAAHEAKAAMNTFTGDGDAKVAVAGVRLKHETGLHTATGRSTFVYVYVDVRNYGNDTVAINPNDFSLATVDGDTVPYDADTFDTGKPFPAVELSPGQQSGGWLVFYLPKDSRYTLTRRDMASGTTVEKTVIP